MNWKAVVIGGIVFYVVMFIISMATGPIVHEGILDPLYIANQQFWRPELNQDPPDMASLMPRWIAVGLITSIVLAALYGFVQSAFSGPGWKRGLAFVFGWPSSSVSRRPVGRGSSTCRRRSGWFGASSRLSTICLEAPPSAGYSPSSAPS